MIDDHPRLYSFCYPCPPEEYGWRRLCTLLPGWRCAVCMVDVPPVALDEVMKAARARWGWPDESSVTYSGGGADGTATWGSDRHAGRITIVGYDENICLCVDAKGGGASWTLSGEIRFGAPMRPLASALDDCETFLREHGCPIPQPDAEEDE